MVHAFRGSEFRWLVTIVVHQIRVLHRGFGQYVAAFVVFNSGMPFDPDEFDFMFVVSRQQSLP